MTVSLQSTIVGRITFYKCKVNTKVNNSTGQLSISSKVFPPNTSNSRVFADIFHVNYRQPANNQSNWKEVFDALL